MKQTWEKFDLDGGGLQSVNLRYRKLQKSATTARLWWLLFPLGAHRFYLKAISALLYPLLSTMTVILLIAGSPMWLTTALIVVGLAIYDFTKLEHRTSQYNKALRIALFLSKENAPPADYQGRYVSDEGIDDYLAIKDQERAGVQPVAQNEKPTTGKRLPSFAEQEQLLKDIARVKRDSGQG